MIGIISDSHDNLTAIRKAVELFNSREVSTVLHAGDIVSPFTVRGFSDLKAELKLVFGNNDGDRLTLRDWYARIGAEVLGDFGGVVVDGKTIALLHGTNSQMVGALVESREFDAVVCGHTHKPEIKKGDCMLINPGELSGVLSGRMTAALLDVGTMRVEIVEM
ncbi:MAG TPA: metallophosphoesterase [Candidatus Methanoperedenaceae archaeon]|nr:metallophosphoesterase [Candidatus Methanoperedenaceae archaeon]